MYDTKSKIFATSTSSFSESISVLYPKQTTRIIIFLFSLVYFLKRMSTEPDGKRLVRCIRFGIFCSIKIPRTSQEFPQLINLLRKTWPEHAHAYWHSHIHMFYMRVIRRRFGRVEENWILCFVGSYLELSMEMIKNEELWQI